jgi:hypothetical protein
MQFRVLGWDDCHVVSCLGRLIFWGQAFVFHGSIVATPGSRAYHWGTFMEAEIEIVFFVVLLLVHKKNKKAGKANRLFLK